jgi:hypothetical protein
VGTSAGQGGAGFDGCLKPLSRPAAVSIRARLCGRAVLLGDGAVVDDGDFAAVHERYVQTN